MPETGTPIVNRRTALKTAVGAGGLVVLGGFAEPASAATTRVETKNGDYYVGNSEMFPHGYNYARQRERSDGSLWHDTFNPDSYSSTESENFLAKLDNNDFNHARVFIDHTNGGKGVVEDETANSLYAPYVDNVVDFLTRARDHGIYVSITFPWIPNCTRYNDIIGTSPDDVEGVNKLWLHQGHIDAKAQYIADLAWEISTRDSDLLNVVFSWEVDNEAYQRSDKKPYTLTSGTITPANGVTYDLSDESDVKQMSDANVNYAVASIIDKLQNDVDGSANVSLNVFTPEAVGRDDPHDIRAQDSYNDPRFPARPVTVVKYTDVDYIDVHVYQAHGAMQDLLDSVEWSTLTTEAANAGIPIHMGEFGAFDNEYDTARDAAVGMQDWWESGCAEGFGGFAYWTFKANGQDMWMATDNEGEIYAALRKSQLSCTD